MAQLSVTPMRPFEDFKFVSPFLAEEFLTEVLKHGGLTMKALVYHQISLMQVKRSGHRCLPYTVKTDEFGDFSLWAEEFDRQLVTEYYQQKYQ